MVAQDVPLRFARKSSFCSLVTQPFNVSIYSPCSVSIGIGSLSPITSNPSSHPSPLVSSYFWSVLEYKTCDLHSSWALGIHFLQTCKSLFPMGTGAFGSLGIKGAVTGFSPPPPVWLQVMNMQCTGNLDLSPLRGRRRRRSGDLPRPSPAIGLQPRAVSTTHLASCTQVALPTSSSFFASVFAFWDLGTQNAV